MLRLVLILIASVLPTVSAVADNADIVKGKVLIESNCAVCHAIGQSGVSPMRDAPPFRNVATRFSTEELEDSLNEGVATEHPAMPDWHMTPDQAREIAAYIMSLTIHGMQKSEVQR